MTNIKKKASIKEDCMQIVLENKDLNNLFDNAERVLEYNLSENLNIDMLHEQLRILGGKSFADVTLFIMERAILSNALDKLQEMDINNIILEKYRYLAAKFGIKYYVLKQRGENDRGWLSVAYNIVKNNKNQYIEFEITLINNEKVICRDRPNSVIMFIAGFIPPLNEISRQCSVDKDLVSDLYNEIKVFHDAVMEKENDVAIAQPKN